jgi:hypothetical protein
VRRTGRVPKSLEERLGDSAVGRPIRIRMSSITCQPSRNGSGSSKRRRNGFPTALWVCAPGHQRRTRLAASRRRPIRPAQLALSATTSLVWSTTTSASAAARSAPARPTTSRVAGRPVANGWPRPWSRGDQSFRGLGPRVVPADVVRAVRAAGSQQSRRIAGGGIEAVDRDRHRLDAGQHPVARRLDPVE